MSNVVDNYGWDSPAGPESCNYIEPKILDILRTIAARRVCDLGSGNGALASTIQKNGYYCIGVEYDKKGVELAQQNYPDISFYNLGVQDDPGEVLKHEHELFDTIVSTEVIEHLFSPHLLLQFSSQILNDKGRIIITTPYHGYLKNLALSVFDKWDKHHTPLWHGGHIKFWSRKTLSALLEQNGFEVTKFYGVGRFPLLWKSMILVAKKK